MQIFSGAFLTALLAGSWAVLCSDLASAQTAAGEGGIADKIVNCAAIAEAADRLICFDELAQPLVGLAENESEASDLSFSGTDHWESNAITLDRPWRAVWQIDANIFSLELRDSDGVLVRNIATQTGEGGGRSQVLDCGTYRLSVRAFGSWRINVVEEE